MKNFKNGLFLLIESITDNILYIITGLILLFSASLMVKMLKNRNEIYRLKNKIYNEN